MGASAGSAAETAPFDLAGPVLRVSVTHGGATLPIAQVPQLATGDTLAIRADLPADQSAHYILVAAFLRGATNPPPDKWFTQSETWTKKGRRGLTLTVPQGAQQVVLFLAPETGGDFPTLRNAVQGRPGAFVRAAQELAQASLDRARLDTYLAAVREAVPADPRRLERITPLLARSLQVKINPDCLTKLPDLQAPCLLQNQEALVLADGHSNAITDALQGPGADLALQLSATPQGGLGYYSPYIAAIRDVIGIFSSIHTAKYQYIPALAKLDGDGMRLVLNAPPSFHNPKSVLVSALPVIAPVHVPPLQVPAPAPQLCARGADQLLPITGAPLIYATHYAHDLALRVRRPDGTSTELPVTPDAERGGLVVQPDAALGDLAAPADAQLHGMWGFQPFDGPAARIQPSLPGQWRAPQGGPRASSVTVTGGAAACVSDVRVDGRPVAWKRAAPDAIAIELPAGGGRGDVAVEITGPPGLPADRLTLAAPPRPERFSATLVAKSVQRPQPDAGTVALTVEGTDAIPSDATLTASLRAGRGARFTGRETIEVATEAGATATLSNGKGLTLADPQIALVRLVPATALGPSAFGPLRARVVQDGEAGDWVPLGTLVRLPDVAPLRCPADPAAACTLSGDGLFLIAAVSDTPGFEQPLPVPAGFAGNSLAVPKPHGTTLYLRLHDDPATIVSLPAG